MPTSPPRKRKNRRQKIQKVKHKQLWSSTRFGLRARGIGQAVSSTPAASPCKATATPVVLVATVVIVVTAAAAIPATTTVIVLVALVLIKSVCLKRRMKMKVKEALVPVLALRLWTGSHRNYKVC